MDAILLNALSCSAVILIPLAVIGAGLWAVVHFLGMSHKMAFLALAGVFGAGFFTGGIVGFLVDPRSDKQKLFHGLGVAALMGIAAFLWVLVVVPFLAAVRKNMR